MPPDQKPAPGDMYQITIDEPTDVKRNMIRYFTKLSVFPPKGLAERNKIIREEDVREAMGRFQQSHLN